MTQWSTSLGLQGCVQSRVRAGWLVTRSGGVSLDAVAGVATTSKALFLSWLIAFVLGAGTVYYFAQPYLCDVKVKHNGKPTYCNARR